MADLRRPVTQLLLVHIQAQIQIQFQEPLQIQLQELLQIQFQEPLQTELQELLQIQCQEPLQKLLKPATAEFFLAPLMSTWVAIHQMRKNKQKKKYN